MKSLTAVFPHAKVTTKNFALELFRRYHFRVCDSIERLNIWRDSTMVDEAFLYYVPTMYIVYHTKFYSHGYLSPCFKWAPAVYLARVILGRLFLYLYKRVERAAMRPVDAAQSESPGSLEMAVPA